MAYRDNIHRTVDWMERSVTTTYQENLNLACGTLICTYSESLGAHLRGCQKERSEAQSNFVAFVRSYLSGFMAEIRDASGQEKKKLVRVSREKVPAEKKELKYPEILYKLFRCGFAHEHLPRYGGGIVRDTGDNHFPYVIDSEPAYDLILNLSHLVPDFLAALRRLKEDVIANRAVSLVKEEGQVETVEAGVQWDTRGEFLLRS